MLRLGDAIAGSDIMQHEVTVGVDDSVAERLGHRAQIAAGRRLVAGVKRLNRRPRFGRGKVRLVTNGATKPLVIPEEFFALLHVVGSSERGG